MPDVGREVHARPHLSKGPGAWGMVERGLLAFPAPLSFYIPSPRVSYWHFMSDSQMQVCACMFLERLGELETLLHIERKT